MTRRVPWRRVHRALLLVLILLVAGCAAPDAPPDAPPPTEGATDVDAPLAEARAPPPPTPAAAPACAHPYPCEEGAHWPRGLEGPFGVAPPANVTVRAADGTRLAGVLWLPRVPEGVRVPVVVEATPYAGSVDPPAWEEAYLDRHDAVGGYVFRDLLADGFALVVFSVRGTGASEGCFALWGATEQEDMVALVEWAGAQPWSNGRVGMYGLSYKGTTPWHAAVRAPQELKTIVVSGILTDMYLAGFTPQGAAWTAAGAYAIGAGGAIGIGPPARAGADVLAAWAQRTGARPCTGEPATLSEHQRSALLDARDAAWYEERRLAARLGNVTAAVLVTAGYADASAHLFQEDTIWSALPRAPKHMVLGHWGHRFPGEETARSATAEHFGEYQLGWFRYWLKGVGALPPGVGAVSYETGEGLWRSSQAWPPPEAREEALHLQAGRLAAAPRAGSASFVSAASVPPEVLLCAASARAEAAGSPLGLVYVGDPVEEPVELAGNAFALLRLSSTLAGGMVSLALLRVPDLAWCADPMADEGALLAVASADLRFHAGGYQGRAFPVGDPQSVRLDLWSHGARLEPGERLAVVVTRAHPLIHDAQPGWAPTLTLHEGSHVVLPIVAGTLGGGAPLAQYPARPFAAGQPT